MMITKVYSHLKTVLRHKYYVYINCKKAGLLWRGIIHDLSKFTPTEFLESVKYYEGTRSPIDHCREETGISKAWIHHKANNKHHYEYWIDIDPEGNKKPAQMPYKDALEAVCDSLGAGMSYSINKGVPFSYRDEYYVWWTNKKAKTNDINDQTKQFWEMMYKTMKNENSNDCLRRSRSKDIYNRAETIVKIRNNRRRMNNG